METEKPIFDAEYQTQCQRHKELLDILLSAHTQLNSRVGVIEENTAVLVERQTEIKQLLEDRRDWEGTKKYIARLSAVMASIGTFLGSVYAVMRVSGRG